MEKPAKWPWSIWPAIVCVVLAALLIVALVVNFFINNDVKHF